MSAAGIKVDSTKGEAIQSCLPLGQLAKFRPLHGLASFYRRFTQKFGSLKAFVTECLWDSTFMRTLDANKSFQLVKGKIYKARILTLLDFDKIFEVNFDASHVGIRSVFRKSGQPIAFFSKKKWCACKVFHLWCRTLHHCSGLRHWRHYHIHREFILNFDHGILNFLNSQQHLNKRHAKGTSFHKNTLST